MIDYEHLARLERQSKLCQKARTFARQVHRGQKRRDGRDVFEAHLVPVAALVAQYGGDELAVAAAYLHDISEDVGPDCRDDIPLFVGEGILPLIDILTEPGANDSPKAPWESRKAGYLAAIPRMDERALLISLCDKIASGRDFADDWLRGEGLDRRERTCRFYNALSEAYAPLVQKYHLERLFEEFQNVFSEEDAAARETKRKEEERKRLSRYTLPRYSLFARRGDNEDNP